MNYPKDLTGLKINRLIVLKRVPRPEHLKSIRAYYLCKCECGEEIVLPRTHLTTGHTASCGCYVIEVAIKNLEGVSEKNRTHGMSGTRFYEIWKKMKHRCYNKNNKNYHNYGGRGIKVCNDWHTFENFMNDMYDSYVEFNMLNGENTATIERIDVNGDYCKENCTWLTILDQQKNRREKF